MGIVRQYSDQILKIWGGSTPAARAGLILLAVLCVGLIGGVGYWSTQPYYVALASDLEPDAMSELVSQLDRANVKYEIRGAGTMLMVDKREWSRARMLAQGKGIRPGGSAVETLSPMDNPLNQHSIEQRNQERALAHSISQYKFVEKATVHLSLPQRHPFLRSSEQASASVLVTVRNGERFGELQAATIASQVANAVEGLTPQRVTVTDTDGNQYSSPDENIAVLGRREDYRSMREQELVSRAHSMLAGYLGHQNIVVRITADFDFPDSETETVVFDPDKKVVVKEETDSSTTTGQDPLALGPAGTVSNIGNGTGTAGNKVVTSKTENTNVVYEASKTVEKMRLNSPTLQKLSVSVVANLDKLKDESGAVTPGMDKKIEAIVKQAIGFREDRDQITVEFLPFTGIELADEAPASPLPWEQINEILKNVSLGIGALVALVVAFMVMKKVNPAPTDLTAENSAESAQRLKQLEQLVEENPEAFAQIISAWANSSAGSLDEAQGESRRAA